jgi:hypothetical protein
MASSRINIPYSLEIDNSPSRRLLVYVASPLATYQTARYDRMLAQAQAHFPDADLLPARGLYHDSAHWRATWPQHLRRITGLLFFADPDSSIGRGVFAELADAKRRGLPLHYLRGDGTLIPCDEVVVELLDDGVSWRRYARVGPTARAEHASSPSARTQQPVRKMRHADG